MENVFLSEARRPETEVTERAKRRSFSTEYKMGILREAERCEKNGEIGALLRREGLYSSLLSKWRQEAAKGGYDALAPKRRGPVPKVVDGRDKRIRELEKQLSRTQRRAERAEALVEVQKKVADLLGIALPKSEEPK